MVIVWARQVQAQYCDEHQAQVRLCEGVQEMLSVWNGVSVLGVVSNLMIEGMPQRLLEANGALGLQRGRGSDQALMIGDTWEAGIAGAARAGIPAAYYARSVLRDSSVSLIRHWDQFRPAGFER